MKALLEERRNKIMQFQKIARKKDYVFQSTVIPDDLFIQCGQCLSALYHKGLEETEYVCPYCKFHFRIGAKKRIEYTVDNGTFEPLFDDIISVDILNMPGYKEKLSAAQELTKMNEAVLTGTAKIDNIKVAIGVLDSNFMMGSMGSVVGERITLLIEYASKENIPLVLFSASGGARMQEGIISLMQMAKTAAALNHYNNLYISVMTNPTTGGVAASFAALGDINIAERTSLIGFAGARVIKQTIQQDLPSGFQTENFQLNKGQVDLVLERKEIKPMLAKLLKMHGGISNE